MNPGKETVVLVSRGGTQRDSMGNRIAVDVQKELKGCSVQPRRLDDTISDTAFASSTHTVLAPVTDAVLAVQPEDRLLFEGVDYRVIGKKIFRDWSGRLVHAKIMVEEQSS